MRKTTAVVLALALAGAGCLGDDGDDGMDDGVPGGDGDGQQAAPPAPITDERTVNGSVADPANAIMGDPCASPSVQCFEYPFTANLSVQVDVTLTWTLEGSDFDLYLYKGDEAEAMAVDPPPETEESFSTTVSQGDYRIVVVAWAVTQDTYTLEATFSAS